MAKKGLNNFFKLINFNSLNSKVVQYTSSKIFRILLFVLVLIFTFILRAHNYEKVPTSNHLDEMLFAWAGLYLVETGTPVSWSTLDYPNRAEVYRGKIDYKGGKPDTYVRLYKPWLDEPPLFSLLVGYSAHLFGADRTQFVPSSYIRFPIVILAAFTSILIFLIARKLSGYYMGIMSMLVYGTVPIFVFASRTAMTENLIAFILALLIYLYLKYEENLKTWLLVPVPILIGIAGLSKPTGYFLLPLCLFLTFLIVKTKKSIKKAFIYCGILILGTLPFIGLFYAYGLYYDPEIFWKITSNQSHRPTGFGSLAWFFITPAYDTAIFRDSWYVFCLLASAFFVFTKRSLLMGKKFILGESVVVLAFAYWIMVVMITGGENDLLPWYRFAAFPFMAIMGAWGIKYLLNKADFFASFIVFGMLLGNKMILVNAFRPNIDPILYRFIFGGLMIPATFNILFSKKWLTKLTKFLIVVVVIVGIYFNTKYIYNAFEITCEAKTCPLLPTNALSTLHFPILWRLIELEDPYYPWEH